MNYKLYNLLIKIIERNDIGGDVKDDILRQYAIDTFRLEKSTTPDEPMTTVPIPAPLNTPEEEVGSVTRPDQHTLDRINNPKLAENEDAIEEDLDRFNVDGNTGEVNTND